MSTTIPSPLAPTPLALPLADGMTLRTLRGPDDIAALAAFTASVFEPALGPFTTGLLTRYPDMQPADQFFVETADGEIVSSLCLIPWRWHYGPPDSGVTLPVGEMGVVATAPAYRRRGLVRAQVGPFKARLAQRGCLLSHIQGIPYYYRQFGYEYALPLEGGWRVDFHQIPAPADSPYTLRPAIPSDLPVLMTLYAQACRDLTIHSLRTPAIWDYLLTPDTVPNAGAHQTWVAVDGDGQVAAYVRLPEFHFGTELVVNEASRATWEVGLAILDHLRRQATAAGQPYIRLNLPANHDLVQISCALGSHAQGVQGAHDQGGYAWQIHIPDLSALLRALVPVLNQRLAASVFARFTGEFVLGLYRDAITLRFTAGQISAVSDPHPAAHTDSALPPMALAPLILGHRSVTELRAAYPDVSVHGQWQLLLETLFPRTPGFLYQVY